MGLYHRSLVLVAEATSVQTGPAATRRSRPSEGPFPKNMRWQTTLTPGQRVEQRNWLPYEYCRLAITNPC